MTYQKTMQHFIITLFDNFLCGYYGKLNSCWNNPPKKKYSADNLVFLHAPISFFTLWTSSRLSLSLYPFPILSICDSFSLPLLCLHPSLSSLFYFWHQAAYLLSVRSKCSIHGFQHCTVANVFLAHMHTLSVNWNSVRISKDIDLFIYS